MCTGEPARLDGSAPCPLQRPSRPSRSALLRAPVAPPAMGLRQPPLSHPGLPTKSSRQSCGGSGASGRQRQRSVRQRAATVLARLRGLGGAPVGHACGRPMLRPRLQPHFGPGPRQQQITRVAAGESPVLRAGRRPWKTTIPNGSAARELHTCHSSACGINNPMIGFRDAEATLAHGPTLSPRLGGRWNRPVHTELLGATRPSAANNSAAPGEACRAMVVSRRRGCRPSN